MAEPSADGRRPNWQYKSQPALEAFNDDKEMLSDAINGSNAMLAALAGEHGPQEFKWKAPAGNWKRRDDSMTSGFMYHRVSLIHQREAHAESLRVFRDPCTYCGTRADIGCKHRRTA